MGELKLLEQARSAGLTVDRDGDRLKVKGPRRAEPLALLLIEHKGDIIQLLDLEVESSKDRQAGVYPSSWTLPDDILDELLNWPDPPSESELQSRGTEILRNHAVARARIELADAADAWDRMHKKIKNRRK
jgi:hypothetical protein